MQRKANLVYICLLIFLVLTIYYALTNGASRINFSDLTNSNLNVLFNIRIPRIISALIAGAALSISGCFLQATLRNPIVDPGIMGISAAANLGQTIALLLIPGFFLGKIILATIGGMLVFLLLIQFQKRLDPIKLLIFGVALDAMLTGIQNIFTNGNSMSLATSTWTTTIYLAIFSVIGIIVAIFLANWANYLKVSDEELHSLGMSPQVLRSSLLLLAVLLASVTTACVGVLAFIGIIVPQIGRILIGHDYQKLISFSMLAGAWFLLFVDTIGRTLMAPTEIAASVLLAIIGGPCMILILLKVNRGHQNA